MCILMPLAEWKEQLKRDVPIPLYYQLSQLIRKDIEDGTYQPGDAMPTEAEFCVALSISRPTVRQSMGELVKEGVLDRIKGKGTFVSHPKVEANFIQKLEGFHISMLSKGMQPRTEVLQLEIVPAIPEYNSILQIALDQPLLLLRRLCFADDIPMVSLECYLPGKRFAGLVKEDLVNNSLYTLFAAHYDTDVVHVHRQIEAVNAGQREADLLGVQKGKALCLVHNIAYDQNGVPVEYNIAYYRGDRNKFTMELKK